MPDRLLPTTACRSTAVHCHVSEELGRETLEPPISLAQGLPHQTLGPDSGSMLGQVRFPRTRRREPLKRNATEDRLQAARLENIARDFTLIRPDRWTSGVMKEG